MGGGVCRGIDSSDSKIARLEAYYGRLYTPFVKEQSAAQLRSTRRLVRVLIRQDSCRMELLRENADRRTTKSSASTHEITIMLALRLVSDVSGDVLRCERRLNWPSISFTQLHKAVSRCRGKPQLRPDEDLRCR